MNYIYYICNWIILTIVYGWLALLNPNGFGIGAPFFKQIPGPYAGLLCPKSPLTQCQGATGQRPRFSVGEIQPGRADVVIG